MIRNCFNISTVGLASKGCKGFYIGMAYDRMSGKKLKIEFANASSLCGPLAI